MPGLSLILDIVIVGLLGATIFYAMRLSRHLAVFRSTRTDMERLIRELSTQITRAQEGVTALDDSAKHSGEELQAVVNKARALTEELTIMMEAGQSLAGRLEQGTTRPRPVFSPLPERKIETPYRDAPESKNSFFAIRDPDFDREEKPDNSTTDPADTELESQAERDLASALRRRRSPGEQ